MATGLVDVHAHFLPDRYVLAAKAAGITRPDGMPMWPSWTVDEHLELMDEQQIAHAVLSVSSPGVHFGDDDAAAALAREVNEYASEVVRRNPERFSFFASIPLPAVGAAVDEAAYAVDRLGARGVIMMSNSGGQYFGDPALDPLWELLNQRRAIAFEHPTSPPGADVVALGRPRPMLEFMFETTRTVTDLMFAAVPERFPDIRFVIPHCGALLPLVADRVELFRGLLPGAQGRPASTVPTREQLQRLWYDMAGTPFPAQAPALVDVVGAGRILYGSDYCWTPAAGVDMQLETIDEHWRELTTSNASRFL